MNTRALSTKMVFLGCKKIDRQTTKEEGSKRRGETRRSRLQIFKNRHLMTSSLVYVFILNIFFLHHPLLVCSLLCFLLLLLSVYLLAPRRRQFLSKALVRYCFLVFRRIGEYISLDLFYNLTCFGPCIYSIFYKV